jgi:hypothetical protein
MKADDERRAEIEAALDTLDRVLRAMRSHARENWRSGYVHLADKGLAALDRVRDARGDECNCYSRAFKDPMQHAPTCPARSPQGEDNK